MLHLYMHKFFHSLFLSMFLLRPMADEALIAKQRGFPKHCRKRRDDSRQIEARVVGKVMP